MPFRRIRFERRVPAAILAGVLAGAGLLAPAFRPDPAGAQSATGRASVRLVQLLDEVPEADQARLGQVHDIRVRLVSGNVLLLRHGGDFIALLPIERRAGSVDSLQYFYYREGEPFLWLIPGAREKAVRTVADGGEIRFPSARLLWGTGPGAGWIYFPDIQGNQGLKFSVVSGRSVDRVDPRETKYWVELGTPGASGF